MYDNNVESCKAYDKMHKHVDKKNYNMFYDVDTAGIQNINILTAGTS